MYCIHKYKHCGDESDESNEYTCIKQWCHFKDKWPLEALLTEVR